MWLNYYKGKCKAVLLPAWSGPEGSRKLRFPDFMTTAQDGGKVVNLTHRPLLPPGSTPVIQVKLLYLFIFIFVLVAGCIVFLVRHYCNVSNSLNLQTLMCLFTDLSKTLPN